MASKSKVLPFSLGVDDTNPALVVPGLLEWTVLLGELKHVRDGIDGMEIADVEAFCWYATPERMTAGFVARTADQRRFHLQCAMDERTWDFSALSVVQIGAHDPLPSPPVADGPASMRWHTETEPYNKELAQQRSEALESTS
jgi:hypothetical protein